MITRSLGIALVALAACADPKPERPRLADSDGAAPASTSATTSASVPQPEPRASGSPSASVSAAPDVSYPDDTIPAPSGSASSSARVDQAVLQEVLIDYARQAGSLRSRSSQDGMLLRRLKPDSALAKAGLREGDVLKDINGLKLVEPDEAVDAYAKLRNAKRFDIHIVRDGKPMTIVLEAK
jgi:general secretion pathway protein C